MTGRWERLAPLTGVLAIAVAFIAVGVIGGSTPDTNDSAQKIFAFYAKHRDKQMGAAFVLSISGGLLIFFAAALRQVLVRPPARGQLASAAFGGGIVGSAGFLLAAVGHLALADSGKYGSPGISQALNILDSNTYLMAAAGIGAMVLAAGISIIRTRVLALWLGILGVVAGVVVFTPAGFFGFLASLLWIVIVSIWLTVRPVGFVAADAAAPAA
jgi:hypothetical protein